MICDTVEELTPIIGTRPACRRSALHRRPSTAAQPARADAAKAEAGAAQGTVRTRARGRAGRAALGPVRRLRA